VEIEIRDQMEDKIEKLSETKASIVTLGIKTPKLKELKVKKIILVNFYLRRRS
jgi:hypothetical protein